MARRLSDRDRWAIGSRTVAAVAGGYTFTWLFTAALALLLRHMMSMTSEDATLAATMASFLVYATVVMAVFRTRSATRAWRGLLIASIPPAFVLALL